MHRQIASYEPSFLSKVRTARSLQMKFKWALDSKWHLHRETSQQFIYPIFHIFCFKKLSKKTIIRPVLIQLHEIRNEELFPRNQHLLWIQVQIWIVQPSTVSRWAQMLWHNRIYWELASHLLLLSLGTSNLCFNRSKDPWTTGRKRAS